MGLIGKLCGVLRLYGVEGKLVIGIKNMYLDSSACIKVKGFESDWFRIDSWVRQGCVMSNCLFNVYMDGGMKEVKWRGK